MPVQRPNILLALAILFDLLGLVWGVAVVLAIAFPGPGGEWTAIYELFGYGVNLPVGAVAAVLTMTGWHGSMRLRSAAVILTAAVFLLPFLGSALLRM
jgi:hypothetical protein